MHVLTKIFIVLVSLLAVLLVPLVAVYAHNEDSFKAKFQSAEARAITAENQLRQATATHTAALSRKDATIDEISSQLADARKSQDQSQSQIRQLESELATVKASQGAMNANLTTLTQSTENCNELVNSLVAKLENQRTRAIEADRELAQMEQRYQEAQSNYEVADAARRELKERITELEAQYSGAMNTISRYVAVAGELPDQGRNDRVAVPADRNLTTAITDIIEKQNVKYAEIAAGSRDGVKPGWVLAISDRDGQFVANLRIIEVDINRSTGVVELENPSARGTVQPGQRAVAQTG